MRDFWLPLAVTAVGLALISTTGQARTELLKNGNFAETTSKKPAGWGANNWNSQAEASVRTDPEKGRALQIYNPSVDDRYDLQQRIVKPSLPKGTILRLSGEYCTENFVKGDGAQFFVSVELNSTDSKTPAPSLHLSLKPTNQWTPFEQSVSLDRDYQVDELVARVVFHRCQGTLYMKQMSLQVVEATEDLTLFSLKKIAPQVDGILNDPSWQGAQVATDFITLGKIQKPSAETEVMSFYDETILYLAVKLQEPNIKNIKVSPLRPNNGDCVEIFLDPENKGETFFHIIVDSKCNLYTAFNDGRGKLTPLEMTVKCAHSDTAWTVEMAIPFASLNTLPPKDNQRWGFNIGRERYAVSPQENSSWAALGGFFQRGQFGKLAFYSRHEIVPDITFWEKSDRDPLMMRPVVSGYDIALAGAATKRIPSLWTYDPFGANRENFAWKSKGWSLRTPAVSEAIEEKYQEFFRAAQGINRYLITKTKADDSLMQLRRMEYYRASSLSPTGKGGGDAKSETHTPAWLAVLEKESAAIDDEMNAVYQTYGVAADAGWKKDLLGTLDEPIAAVSARIAAFQQWIEEQSAAIGQDMKAVSSWKNISLEIPDGDRMLNPDGASQRFSFSAYGFIDVEEPYSLLTTFGSTTLHAPGAIPRQPAAGQYDYEGLDKLLSPSALNFDQGLLQVTFGLAHHYMPLSPELVKKIPTDADILLVSQDGLKGRQQLDWGEEINLYTGVNPNNPEVMAYARDYLTNLASHVAPTGKMDFFITGWEDTEFFYPLGKDGTSVPRSLGYNESGKTAFRDYLKEQYATIGELNQKWRTTYSSFASIEPPNDKHIKPPARPSGLTFEFERWQRVNHARYLAKLGQFLKEGAPNIPVMVDPSRYLTEMNGYLLFKENVADIYSYHSNPATEEALWTYFSTMRRKFGKELGYHENYFPMYGSGHLKDERLSKRDIRRWFFDLLMRDIRCSTWWLYFRMSQTTEYAVAYGGGFFGLDFDHTILRWSSTEVAPMFARIRNIEKALVESQLETPKTAIIQPCTTIFTFASLGQDYTTSPAIQEMFATHYQLLMPGNYPHDYLPEEMVLDGKASLDDYTVLVLPYAPYLNERFAEKLMNWTRNGGTLVAVGPFGLFDKSGLELPVPKSLFKTLYPGVKKIGAGDWAYGTDGKSPPPSMETKRYGKGTLVYLNRSSDVLGRNSAIKESIESLLASTAQRTASSPEPDLKILVREKDGGEKYLCLSNQNVEEPIETTVTVKGKFSQALDIFAPGWFPVPSEIKGNKTELKIRLDPGDFTMILLKPQPRQGNPDELISAQ